MNRSCLAAALAAALAFALPAHAFDLQGHRVTKFGNPDFCGAGPLDRLT